jgi:hypothetical protein
MSKQQKIKQQQTKKENGQPIFEGGPVKNELPTMGLDDIDKPVEPLNETDSAAGRAISMERWRQAQEAEKACHKADENNTEQHYAETYKKYFKYVGLGTDLEGLNVIEIGPAMHPALAICKNYGRALIIEPMASPELENFCKFNHVGLLQQPLEYTSMEITGTRIKGITEVWLFNVMQHVIDPEEFVNRCKTIADRIRFFEPINTPIETHHPHSFTGDDYVRWFGEETKFYQGGTEPGFHTADCAYGVWIKQ